MKPSFGLYFQSFISSLPSMELDISTIKRKKAFSSIATVGSFPHFMHFQMICLVLPALLVDQVRLAPRHVIIVKLLNTRLELG